MISTKNRFNPMPIVLIVFVIFTISLVENLQIADGFSASAVKMNYELDPGDTQVLVWPISNISEETINIEFYATGKGSEFLVFENYATIEPKVRTEFDVFVIIPKDHPDNIEYHPQLFALKRGGELAEGVSGMTVNSQVRVDPVIKIGDNPIFTPEPSKENIIPEKKQEQKQEKKQEKKQEHKETIEEKLARIQAANQAMAPEEVIVDDVFEESFEEEAVSDYQPEPYVAEPTESLRPTPHQEEEKNECGFIDWLLSLFGMAKC